MIPSSYQPIGSDSPSENDENFDPESDEASQQSKWRKAIQRVRKADKSFLVSKAFYFFFYTALGSLFPFFSLFYKQLWLTPGEIGLLLALRPAVKLVCLPLWKMVTDRFSKPKVVYFISILGWTIGYFGQSFVYPSNIPCYGYAAEGSTIHEFVLSTPPSTLLNSSFKPDSNISTRELVLNSHLSDSVQKWDPRKYGGLNTEGSLLKNIKSVKTIESGARKAQSVSSWSQLNGHDANKDKMDVNVEQTAADSFNQKTETPVALSKQKLHMETIANRGLPVEDDSHAKGPHENNKKELLSDSTEDKIIKRKGHYGVRPYEKKGSMVKSPRPKDDFRVVYNTWVFRTLILIVILTEIITTPTPMLADNAIVRSLVETDSEYGKQRLFGSLGLSLAAILVAVWVSLMTDCVYTDTINYLPCFYIFEIAIGVTVLVSLCVEFNRPLEEEPNGYEFQDAMKLFNNFKNGVFLVTLFAFGYFHSLQNAFLFWYLQDLGGTPVLFSIILLVYCLAEVIMYFLSGHVVEAIGQQGMICLAFACYTARYLMYTYLKDPWLVIPMEMVQGITYGGVWSIAAVYVNAPQGWYTEYKFAPVEGGGNRGSRGWKFEIMKEVVLVFNFRIALHTAGAPEIRINQLLFSRREKVCCRDVNSVS